jgi:hypothetical protein
MLSNKDTKFAARKYCLQAGNNKLQLTFILFTSDSVFVKKSLYLKT